MAKLRVLEVSKSTGGLGTYMRWLAQGLDLERFTPTFACLSDNSRELAEELARIPGVSAVHSPMTRFKINLAGDAALIYRIRRLLRLERFDIVHGHGSKAGFIVRAAAMGTSTRVAYSPHGFAFHERQRAALTWLYTTVERFAARRLTNRIITVSDGEQAEARRYRIGSETKFVTVHSGIEPERFGHPVDRAALRASLGIPRDAYLVGTVGRLNEQKAPFDFVRVAANVRAMHTRAHFLWVGDGALEPAAKTLACDLGVSGAVTFAGQRSDVPQLLSAMDAALLTSHWEALPIVILEAMASSLPVVATDLPGITEVVTDGVEGLLAPAGNVEALSAALQRLILEPALVARLRATGRARVEREFTREMMMRSLMRVYDRMTQEGQ
jgi:glycosyltransferase involved in cell wall biosynthesis